MALNGICHVEWTVSSLERAKQFYGGMFGWTFEPMSDNYLLFRSPDGIGGGFGQEAEIKPGATPIVYIEVEDVAAHLERAVSLGGAVTHPQTPMGENRAFAVVTDPDGNTVGLYHSRQ